MEENAHFKDPKIPTEIAIAKAGNKNKLATKLGIKRSSVQTWGEFVPKLQAYRLLLIFPDLDK